MKYFLSLAFIYFLSLNLKLNAQEPNEFFFANRKLIPDAYPLIQDARLNIAEFFQSSRRFARILDFNFGDESLGRFNLISSDKSGVDFNLLSDAEKEILYFRKYLDSLLAARRGKDTQLRLIHMDHHYPHQSLAKTSTSVLAIDFVLWLHDAQENARISKLEFYEALDILVNSIPILDHADPDIIISNFVISHAGEIKFLRKWEAQLKSVALFNDYLRRSFVDPRQHQKSILIWTALRSLENAILSSELNYSRADSILFEILKWAEEIESNSEANLLEFASKNVESRNQKFSPANLFFNSYSETEKQREVFRKVFSQSPGIISRPEDIQFGRAYSCDGILLTMLEAQLFEMESSALVDFLLISKPKIAAHHRLALSVSVHPETKATFVKMRALNPDLDLNSVIQKLRKTGFNAGGRAQAGSAAYGTTGILDISLANLQADLFGIIEILRAEFGCKNGLNQLGLKAPSKAY